MPPRMLRNALSRLSRSLSFTCCLYTALFLGFTARAATEQSQSATVYFGTFSRGSEGGIFSAQLDLNAGTLSKPGLAISAESPGFLALDAQRRTLYAIVEPRTADGKSRGGINAYRIAPGGALEPINHQITDGGGFCHVSLDRSNRFVFAARYGDGNAVVFPLSPQGEVQPVSSTVQHEGSGPNRERQEKAHAHAISVDPANRFAFVADLGTDEVRTYVFDSKNGRLTAHTPPATRFAPGSGPRHFTFHPTLPILYVVCELDQTVVTLHYDSERGILEPLQTVALIPEGTTGDQRAAEVVVHPSGKFVYASNRGYDALVAFRVDPQSGTLTFVERHREQIEQPRNFAIDPTGRWLLCANRTANNVHVYEIDTSTGRLTPTGRKIDVPEPVCVRFLVN